MKKRRGLKRYYRNLSIQNDFDKMTWLNFNKPDHWFDRWHLHFDWEGYGNKSFKRRKPHLDKLFRHFEILVNKTKLLQIDFQLFAMIWDFDSYNDALYLHSPNPNGSPFPYKMTDLTSTCNLTNQELITYINDLKGYTILYGKAGENFCLIYKEKVGQPLV